MKNISIIPLIVMAMLLSVACHNATDNSIVGKKEISIRNLKVDSLVISGDSTSFDGHFEFVDTNLLFIDRAYCKIFPFSIYSGQAGKPVGGYGKGPNEMMGIIAGSAIEPADTSMWILDANNGIYEYLPKSDKIHFLDRLDFSWDKLERNNFESPSLYNTLEATFLGIKMMDMGNNELLMPVSIVTRHLDENNADRNIKGHIFGLCDKTSLKVKKVFGRFPDYYKDNPLPLFEFFDFAMNRRDSLLYVNHAPDSLIYCYRYPDSLLYTIGFEPHGLHRDFSHIGYDIDISAFRKDLDNVSLNTGLYYDPVDELLFRTSVTDYKSGNSVLQVYKDRDLVVEAEVPQFFKMLGRVGDRYYAVRMEPIETENEEIQFILYSFDKLPMSK